MLSINGLASTQAQYNTSKKNVNFKMAFEKPLNKQAGDFIKAKMRVMSESERNSFLDAIQDSIKKAKDCRFVIGFKPHGNENISAEIYNPEGCVVRNLVQKDIPQKKNPVNELIQLFSGAEEAARVEENIYNAQNKFESLFA